MINIIIYKKYRKEVVARLNITDRITLIMGNSGTGKTHM